MMLSFDLPGFFISDANYYYLFYIITGVAIGIVLCGIYSAFWQFKKKSIFKLLLENEAYSLENGMVINSLDNKKQKSLLKLLKDPSCILYRYITSDALESYNQQIEADLATKKHVSRETKYKLTGDSVLFIRTDMVDRVKRESEIKEILPNLIIAEVGTVFIWFLLMMLMDRIIEAVF